MRYKDWQQRFWLWMQHEQTQRFVWGTRDCILFAARGGDAISDARYVERAKAAFAWTNAREAAEILGTQSLQSLVESVMGSMQSRARLGMGDFALVTDDAGRESLAIHDGAIVIGAADYGVQQIPFRYVKGGWHVT